jgi:hypothetical protein
MFQKRNNTPRNQWLSFCENEAKKVSEKKQDLKKSEAKLS